MLLCAAAAARGRHGGHVAAGERVAGARSKRCAAAAVVPLTPPAACSSSSHRPPTEPPPTAPIKTKGPGLCARRPRGPLQLRPLGRVAGAAGRIRRVAAARQPGRRRREVRPAWTHSLGSCGAAERLICSYCSSLHLAPLTGHSPPPDHSSPKGPPTPSTSPPGRSPAPRAAWSP